MLKLLFLPTLLLLISCSEPMPRKTEVPTYQTIHHLTLPGAFFHFSHKGKLYLACSTHQGGTGTNAQLKVPDSQDALVLKKRVHTQKDLQVWTYEAPSLSTDSALPYFSDPKAQVGDRVYILNRKKKIAGTIIAAPKDSNFRYMFQTEKPFAAGGMSGSPIFSRKAGAVIGVLQVANNKKAATLGGFELLLMP